MKKKKTVLAHFDIVQWTDRCFPSEDFQMKCYGNSLNLFYDFNGETDIEDSVGGMSPTSCFHGKPVRSLLAQPWRQAFASPWVWLVAFETLEVFTGHVIP